MDFTVAVHTNGLGCWFQAAKKSAIACSRSSTLRKEPRRICLLVNSPNQRSTRLSHLFVGHYTSFSGTRYLISGYRCAGKEPFRLLYLLSRPNRTSGSCSGHQVSQSTEIVSSPGEGEQPPHLVDKVQKFVAFQSELGWLPRDQIPN
jgi:hypothetical protein